MAMSTVLIVATIACFVTSAIALKCITCGEYNDGVGSITPCINYTNMPLKDCPSLDYKYCIKYVSEGSTVRDCVGHCQEKESWSTKTYCCDEDGCNSSDKTHTSVLLVLAASILSATGLRVMAAPQ